MAKNCVISPGILSKTVFAFVVLPSITMRSSHYHSQVMFADGLSNNTFENEKKRFRDRRLSWSSRVRGHRPQP